MAHVIERITAQPLSVVADNEIHLKAVCQNWQEWSLLNQRTFVSRLFQAPEATRRGGTLGRELRGIEKVMRDLGAERGTSPVVLKTGLCTGALLIIVMFGSVVAANRCPSLEAYAFERNAISYTLFVLLTLTPVWRFLANPSRAFASSTIAWMILTAGYDAAGFFFRNLFDAVRLTPFQLLIDGTVVYAILATSSWLVQMALYARHHPIKSTRKLSATPVRHVR